VNIVSRSDISILEISKLGQDGARTYFRNSGGSNGTAITGSFLGWVYWQHVVTNSEYDILLSIFFVINIPLFSLNFVVNLATTSFYKIRIFKQKSREKQLQDDVLTYAHNHVSLSLFVENFLIVLNLVLIFHNPISSPLYFS